MVIRVGPAGWSYSDWEGVVYPRPKPRGFHALPFLARFFDLIELNASFYALPEQTSCAQWASLVKPWPAFRFTAKLPQELTHASLDANASKQLARAFEQRLEPLSASGRLLGLLAQFPIGFQAQASSFAHLETLLEWFDPAHIVLELRHASWFSKDHLARIQRLGVSLADIDLPASSSHPPAHVPPIGRLGYLRLHGRNSQTWFQRGVGRDQRYDYLYSPAEVSELAKRAQRLAGEHDETAVVTNNHFSGQAVANALELKALLTSERVLAPADLVRAFPHLAGSVRAAGQNQLFDGA